MLVPLVAVAVAVVAAGALWLLFRRRRRRRRAEHLKAVDVSQYRRAPQKPRDAGALEGEPRGEASWLSVRIPFHGRAGLRC